MVADERLGVGLRQPKGILATPEPLQHHLLSWPRLSAMPPMIG